MFEVFAQTVNPQVQVNATGLPIVSFGELLTFLIRLFFFIAGIAALFYGLRGALSWITSGGAKEEVDAARDKIVAAVTGVFVIIVVLSLIVALEQFVFNRQLCFGLSCPATIPSLMNGPDDGTGTGTETDAGNGGNGSAGGVGADSAGGNAQNEAGTNSTFTPTPTRAQLPATGGGGR